MDNAEIESRTAHFAGRWADWVIANRWWVLVASVVLLLLTASGVQYLAFSNNYRAFFSPDNPDLLTFDNFQKTYTKNDNLMFVVQHEDKSIFTPEMADAVEQLTAAAWKIPFATRVDSVSNFQHSYAKGDELIVDDLYRKGSGLGEQALAERQQIALDEPLLNGFLLSPDSKTTGVNVTLNFPEKSLTELPQAVAAARQLADDIESRYPGTKVALTGISALNNAFAAAGQADATALIPAMYGVLLLVTFLTLRSLSGMVTTVLVIMFSTASAMGLAGYLGIALDPIAMTSAIVILTLSIADSVHILMSMLDNMREGEDKLAALRHSIRTNFLAVSVTSITTIVGFLCLNFSDAPPFWYLGNITAMGIAAAWLYSLTFLPALITLLPFRIKPSGGRRILNTTAAMTGLARFVTNNYRAVLMLSIAIAVILISQIPRITLDDQWVEYFDHRIEFRNDAEFAMDNLTGIYLLEYSVPADGAGGVSEPEYLHNLQRFTDWLREYSRVIHVYSYTDIIKRLNKNMHADDASWYRLPDNRELAAQYLLLYELSLPYGLDLNDRISIDKSATRITVTMEEMSTADVRAFIDLSTQWLQNNTPQYMWNKPTGATVMFSYISERNINSMLGGNLVAVLGIALILIISLRSFALGSLSLIPNLVPILMTFGAWGLLVGQVGMGAATVSATSLGIIVDNTVHFLTKYLYARRSKGANRPTAIEYAFRTVGMAVAANAVILTSGFAVLAYSSFKVNTEMGMLTAMAIVIALVIDFLLLPAMLMVGYKKEETDYEDEDKLAAEIA